MSSQGGGGGGGEQQISIDSLSVQQLAQVKKQLEEELNHLGGSIQQLYAAQAKFRQCMNCIQGGKSPALEEGKQILVPLTNSLYVNGTLSNTSHVIVDVGTGFYVEKDIKSAVQFYENKTNELAASIKDLETIIQGKNNNARMLDEVLRQKMEAPAQQAAQS